jgi:hypothetical protein
VFVCPSFWFTVGRRSCMSAETIRRQWGIAVLLSVALIGVLGASFATPVAAQSAQPAATIQFVNAIAGGGPVDILLDGNVIAKDLAFGTATNYASLPPGDHGVKVLPAGQDQGQSLIDQTVTADGGGAYDFLIGSQNNQYQAQFLKVDLSAVAVGQARYRIVQAAPDLGDVTIQLGVAGGTTNGTGANSASTGNAGFLADAGYQDVASGTYALHVVATGSTQDLFSAPSVTLDSGQVYDLIIIGQNADKSLKVLPLVTTVSPSCGSQLGVGGPTDACIRFIHASPDAGAVDILVDGGVVAQNISYGTVTQFAAVADASHQIQVVPTGQPASAAVLSQTLSFSAGQAYQFSVLGLKADGSGGDQGLRLHQDQLDLTPLPAGQARIRLIHAIPGGGDATVATTDGTTLIDSVSFDNASSYLLVDAGSYDLQVTLGQSDNQSPITITAKGTTFQAGMAYDLFLIGRSTDNSAQVLVVTAPATVRSGAQGTPVALSSPAASTPAPQVGTVAVTAIANTPVATLVGTAPSTMIATTATATAAVPETPTLAAMTATATATSTPSATATSTPATTIITVTVTPTP